MRYRPRGFGRLGHLCRDPGVDRSLMDTSIAAIEKRGARDKVTQLLVDEVLENKQAQPFLANLLLDRLVKLNRLSAASGLVKKLVPRRPPGGGSSVPPIAHAAAQAWLSHTGKVSRRKYLLPFLRRHRRFLAVADLDWAWVGYALRRARLYRRAVRWMADWKKRPAIDAWMLLTLAEASPQSVAMLLPTRFTFMPAR